MAKSLSIEVDLSQIRVAEVVTSGKKVRVTRAFRFPVPQGAVEDGQIRDTSGLGATLKKELADRHIRTRKAGFIATSSRIASREVFLPGNVKEKQIRTIVQTNATEYFPIDITKYNISGSSMGKVEKAGGEKQHRLMVYAAPKSVAAACQEMAEAAGLSMTRVDYIGNTIFCAVKNQFTKGVHLLMKIEEENTLITIVRDGSLALQRSLNYGVDGAVDAVQRITRSEGEVDYEAAVGLLRAKRGILVPGEEEAPAAEESGLDETFTYEDRREITDGLRYLVGSVTRIMDYYVSRNQDVEFDTLACCGLGAEFLGMPEFLSGEIGQRVDILKMDGYAFPANLEQQPSCYAAAVGYALSGVNLMEKAVKQKKIQKDSLTGAVMIFLLGAGAGAALCVSGFMVRTLAQSEQDRINNRIDEESAIEEVYNTYNATKQQYSNFQTMYSYTATPNEGLKDFIEEMEEKMPSDITVENLTSTGTTVSFSVRVQGKSQAANTLMQLRTFDSLLSVTTTGIDESDDGTVSMSVSCTYREQAPLDAGTN